MIGGNVYNRLVKEARIKTPMYNTTRSQVYKMYIFAVKKDIVNNDYP